MNVVVVTVCLNAEATIAETIRSVREQEGVNLRHLVVDGGSTDRTLAVVEALSWEGLALVRQVDLGIYDAMGKSILHLRPDEHVLFLNADDRLAGPRAMKEALADFDGQGVLCSRIRWLDLGGKPAGAWGDPPTRLSLLRGMVAHHQGMVVPVRAFSVVGGFDPRYRISADYDWLVRCVESGIAIHWSDEVLAEVRLGGASDRMRARSSLERGWILLRRYPLPVACRAIVGNVLGDLVKGATREVLRMLGLLEVLRRFRPPRVRGA